MNFNGEMLTLARQRAGATQKELSAKTGVPASTISRMEAGLMRLPQRDTIEKLASAVGVPVAFFDRPDEVRHLGLHRLYRLQRKVNARELDRLEAELNIRRLHFFEVLGQVEVESSLALPDLGALTDRSPTEAARFMRATWSLRTGPIGNLTALLEAAGVLVLEIDNVTSAFEGLAVHAYGGRPIIFVKAGQSGDRRRFTLAHELAHLLLHPAVSDDHDRQANEFAAEFLFPETEARQHLGNFNVMRAIDIKRLYRVSLQFLAQRAANLNLMSSEELTRFYKMMSARGWRANEPGEVVLERPMLGTKLINVMVNDLQYTIDELAELFRETPELVRTYYNFSAPAPKRLKLVP